MTDLGDDTQPDVDASDSASEPSEAAALAAAVLSEENKRKAEQVALDTKLLLPDDLLPGVGDEEMNLKQAIAAGGVSMVLYICLLYTSPSPRDRG